MEYKNKLSDILGFIAIFALLVIACPLGLLNLSYYLITPLIFQAILLILSQ